MAKGIIYLMTTIVPGLIKIGKTGTQNFESRMYNLEHDGYRNVTGLKRCFAIEVDEYDEKEALIHSIFSKSRVEDTELFALDVNLVKQLLVSFDGTQVYPVNETKAEVFEDASGKRGMNLIPEGTYYMCRKVKAWENRECKATMKVKGGKFIVQKGSMSCPIRGKGWTTTKIIDEKKATTRIVDGIIQEDVEFTSPSLAASFVVYMPTNGWTDWKTADGRPIDVFRSKKD